MSRATRVDRGASTLPASSTAWHFRRPSSLAGSDRAEAAGGDEVIRTLPRPGRRPVDTKSRSREGNSERRRTPVWRRTGRARLPGKPTLPTSSLLASGRADLVAPNVLSLLHWEASRARRALRYLFPYRLAFSPPSNISGRPSNLLPMWWTPLRACRRHRTRRHRARPHFPPPLTRSARRRLTQRTTLRRATCRAQRIRLPAKSRPLPNRASEALPRPSRHAREPSTAGAPAVLTNPPRSD